MKTRMLLSLVCALAPPSFAYASVLTVTCGKNAYEALEKKKLDMAEFYAVLELKGPANPPVLKSLVDDGNDLKSGVQAINYSVAGSEMSVQIAMKNFNEYSITGLTGCADLDTATGKIAFTPYVGGFAGRGRTVIDTCSCQKQ